MAEARAVPAVADDDAVASYFEVHVRRGDRWVIDWTSPLAADALAEAEDLARKVDVQGVKVVNERYDRRTEQSAARVIFKLEKPERKRPSGFARPMAAGPLPAPATGPPPAPAAGPPSAPAVRPPKAQVMPDAEPIAPSWRPRHPGPASPPAPWELFAWASVALAVAAALLFGLLLLVT
jgi:hypothetical protein